MTSHLPPRPVREPATILARPSALAASRLTWAFACAVLTVTVPTQFAVWMPWWAGALAVTCFIDAGTWCAVAWTLAVIAATAALPPGGDSLPTHVIAGCAAVASLRLGRHLPPATPFAPLILGALAGLAHDAALIAVGAADDGVVQVDAAQLLARVAGAAALTGLVTAPWVGWARRERARGRA